MEICSNPSSSEDCRSIRGNIQKLYAELKTESSRLQMKSAPPIISSNLHDIHSYLEERARGSGSFVPIPRTAYTLSSSTVAGRGSLEVEVAEAGPVLIMQRKTVAVRGIHSAIMSGSQRASVSASVLPSCSAPPSFVSWSYLKHNELAPDQGKRMFYTDPDTGETIPDSDDDCQDNMPWEGQRGPAIDYAMKGVVREFGSNDTVISTLAHELGIKPQAVATRLNAVVESQTEDGMRENQEVDEVLDSFFGVFCRRCRIFCCRLHHGGNHIRPHEKRGLASLNLEPCSSNCWIEDPDSFQLIKAAKEQQLDAVDEDVAATPGPSRKAVEEPEIVLNRIEVEPVFSPWSKWEESLLARAQLVCGLDCCAISRMLGSRSCKDVAYKLVELGAKGQTIGWAKGADAQGGGANKPQKKARKAFFSSGKRSGIFKKRMNHQENGLWSEYIPCNCVGSCDGDNCSCHRVRNFCEKFCGCAPNCTNRFRGCTCKGQCRTRQCPCLAAGRECDPDLCKSCCSTCEGTAVPGTECLNMKLRMRQHVRVMMGKSTVQGWGAFVQRECKEDDFLGEYTGDLISQEEADRRGRIYDKINNSYLFNLNEQRVLDARHRGNKFRFANHSPKPNSKVRLTMVDGDWRVAVYANRNIRPHEELFYDYRYDQDVKPDWAQEK
ncbi:hypothetical protein CEUSTIGMA_g3928.t1 [Chlamydomonas eustigma]|uniref:[histone H3]-lysine(27) N-trimethyltransferase n=1 Tax=Chlamydomonas eustigma TaxID=1157962 RepID=A0A250X076_9CHLO|nr:hypothetical protein CEUSTIGMA_g3928.t1 [Chlamydomonas eustigma]|eukprot:GAX76483.1 hypothetical protein CEUSTIGMA_g3928.t1 [Chlamydomonas eustigma]